MSVPVAITAEDAVRDLKSLWRTLRNTTQGFIAQCDTGTLNLFDIALFLTKSLANYKVQIATAAAVSGVGQLLATQYPAKFINAAAADSEIASFQTGLNTFIVYLETNIPKDAGQRLSIEVLANNGTGTSTPRTTSSAPSIAGFKAALESFRDTIDIG